MTRGGSSSPARRARRLLLSYILQMRSSCRSSWGRLLLLVQDTTCPGDISRCMSSPKDLYRNRSGPPDKVVARRPRKSSPARKFFEKRARRPRLSRPCWWRLGRACHLRSRTPQYRRRSSCLHPHEVVQDSRRGSRPPAHRRRVHFLTRSRSGSSSPARRGPSTARYLIHWRPRSGPRGRGV